MILSKLFVAIYGNGLIKAHKVCVIQWDIVDCLHTGSVSLYLAALYSIPRCLWLDSIYGVVDVIIIKLLGNMFGWCLRVSEVLNDYFRLNNYSLVTVQK